MNAMHDSGPIYLSPHHDDACFSLATAALRLGGVVLNLFTISAYTDEDLKLSTDPTVVSRIRDAEDLAFAEASGLARFNLDRLDSPLRDRDPFDATDIAPDVEELRPYLRRALDGLVITGHRRLLFCPAAIGGHRDHIVTRDVVLTDYDELGRDYRIVFYEDLPYAADRGNRDSGLDALRARTESFGYRHVFRLPASEEKLRLVRLYRSQFDRLPEDLSQFTPADGTDRPHEAAWVNEAVKELEDWEAVRRL
jgi:hypothetical protein